jgi:serine protease Do
MNITLFFSKFFILLLIFTSSIVNADQETLTKEKINKFYNSVVSIDSKVPQEARTARSLGTTRQGSGVIIDNNNILTIGYIVIEASEILIGLPNGKKIPGKLTGYDHSSGFGIVSPIIKTELTPLIIGNSNNIKVDDTLLIIPSPQKGIGSMAKMVSRRPFVGWWEYLLEQPIYTLPMNQSWAGAPLISSKGEILGVGSLFVQDAAFPGTISPGNMFVPINLLKPILNDLIKHGRRKTDIKPYMGISTTDSSGKVIITRVSKKGPAEKSGLKKNDIIKSVNGKPVSSVQELYKTVWRSGSFGVEINFEVIRNEKNINFKVKTVDRMDYFIKNQSY